MSLIAGTVFLQLTDDTVENGISMLGVLFYSLYVMYEIITYCMTATMTRNNIFLSAPSTAWWKCR
jgi:hypothetical protein